MATTTAPPSVEHRAAPPTPAGRRLRIPQLTVGLLLVAATALAFVLYNAASVQRTPVLALADDVTRGQTLVAEDLRVVHIGSDDTLALTPADAAEALVGRAAVSDLPAGSLVVDEQFATGATLTPGGGVVGLALSPGEYPSPRLGVGDLVNVVSVAEEQSGVLLVEAAEVVGIEPVGTQGQQFISLLAGEAVAGEVATAAARGEVRLVLIARNTDDRSRADGDVVGEGGR